MVFSETWESHLRDLEEVLKMASECGFENKMQQVWIFQK